MRRNLLTAGRNFSCGTARGVVISFRSIFYVSGGSRETAGVPRDFEMSVPHDSNSRTPGCCCLLFVAHRVVRVWDLCWPCTQTLEGRLLRHQATRCGTQSLERQANFCSAVLTGGECGSFCPVPQNKPICDAGQKVMLKSLRNKLFWFNFGYVKYGWRL